MKLNLNLAPAVSDEELCRLSLEGDREAFGQIVQRYQSLICSVAYSASGRLAESEDLAQETFVTAWKRFTDLKEPAKLRQWLCGIVRNLAANASRRFHRRGGAPESIDLAPDHASPVSEPGAEAIQREEEQLLWRTLGSMPENYREPLILFYREQQSVAEVARQLDLTEDTVKQRLFRGRSMLREEMSALVESTLTRTKPGSAFTVAVLVALPLASASTASAALAAGTMASNSGAVGKGLLAKIGLGALVGPMIGLACAYFGTRAATSSARSKPERDTVLRYARWIVAFCFILSIGLAGVLSQAGKLYAPSALAIVIGVSVWMAVLVGGILLGCQWLEREVKRIRVETNTNDAAYSEELAAHGKQLRLPKYFESKLRLLGLPLVAIAWGGTSSDAYRPRKVYGWLAVGDIAISPFLAFGGFAIAPIAVGAITVGVLSLSVFWGVAVGVLALGSLAIGWWALGCAAAGVKCAVGFAAIARDYAVGIAGQRDRGRNPCGEGTGSRHSGGRISWNSSFIKRIGGLPGASLLRSDCAGGKAGSSVPGYRRNLLLTFADSRSPRHIHSVTPPQRAPSMTSERFHSLDALRAFALLLGVCLHSAVSFVLPPGLWAVGTAEPDTIPSLFVYYVHCFRMEVFFLLAGFFAHLVIEKRGLRSFLRDRFKRIVLVFLVALYPMKLMLGAAWMIGGRHTGWLQLPPEIAALPWWQLAIGGLTMESWSNIGLTHLWFLYYLICITALFLIVRGLIAFVVAPDSAVNRLVQTAFRRVLASWFAPIVLVAMTVPVIAFMEAGNVDTPEKGFAWNLPVLLLYGLFFAMGWLLRGHTDLLAGLGRRWVVFLPLSLIVSVMAAAGVGAQMSNLMKGVENPASLHWATAFGTSLTMNFAVLGWLGLFVRLFKRSMPWTRYLADASYWVYLVHLPVVVALQISLASWIAPWWIKWPIINAIALPVLLLSYHWCVRRTWIGAWLNGRRTSQASTMGTAKADANEQTGEMRNLLSEPILIQRIISK